MKTITKDFLKRNGPIALLYKLLESGKQAKWCEDGEGFYLKKTTDQFQLKANLLREGFRIQPPVQDKLLNCAKLLNCYQLSHPTINKNSLL